MGLFGDVQFSELELLSSFVKLRTQRGLRSVSRPGCPLRHALSSPWLLAAIRLFPIPVVLPFPEYSMASAFGSVLLLLSNLPLRLMKLWWCFFSEVSFYSCVVFHCMGIISLSA